MGNRGVLHDQTQTLGKARWRHKAWIICSLSFKGRHSEVMPTNGYTRLFFLDEAVALAAGHRPCYECRRNDYTTYMNHWASAHKSETSCASDVDNTLHSQRVHPSTRQQITATMPIDDLPDGIFIQLPNEPTPYLIFRDGLFAFRNSGYAPPVKRPKSTLVSVLTPLSTIKVLRSGFKPALHSSIKL